MNSLSLKKTKLNTYVRGLFVVVSSEWDVGAGRGLGGAGGRGKSTKDKYVTNYLVLIFGLEHLLSVSRGHEDRAMLRFV